MPLGPQFGIRSNSTTLGSRSIRKFGNEIRRSSSVTSVTFGCMRVRLTMIQSPAAGK